MQNNFENRIDRLENMLEKLLIVLGGAKAEIKPSPLLYDWLEEWYTVYKVPKLKPTGAKQIRICIDRHIKPHLQNVPLDSLTASDVDKMAFAIQSPRMRKYAYDTICAALKKAYMLDKLQTNIADKTEKVAHVREKGRALTIEERKAFKKAIQGNRLEKLYLFYLNSGCRKSEALSLTWSDVNFREKRIHIPGTKTQASDRYIPIFPALDEILRSLPKKGDSVFGFSDDDVKNNWRWLRRKNSFTFCIHSLRHTFATVCMENGININVVKNWLGHSKASTTSDIYTHVQTEFERKETAKYIAKMKI